MFVWVVKKFMKVLYFAEWDAFSSSGVIRKIKAQFETWRSLGVDCRLIILSPDGGGRPPAISGEGITVVEHRVGRFGLGKVFKIAALRNVERLLRSFQPDVVYYRQSSWTPGVLRVLKVARSFVVEVNSNDVLEIGHYGFAKARYHLMSRKWLIDAASGFVCVGRELGEYYRQYGKPVEVIGNGFDVESVTPRPAPYNDRVQLVFVGSPGQAWHGVDKLVAVADSFPDMDFHIVGETVKNPPSNFVLHGFLGWEDLSTLYKSMDFGFGTLALHRKSMDEISPLKTREYVAYGLPVIGAYEDTDLEGCDFFLRLPNDELGVQDSVPRIREFISKWRNREIDPLVVRAKVDSQLKEVRRLGFMKSFLN